MPKIWDSVLLLPKLARLASRVPKNPHHAWENYWAGITRTGKDGEVLWDAAAESERLSYLVPIKEHFDPALPVVDIGCGNGTYTRWLATLFPQVLGVDVSASAVRRAQAEAAGEGIRDVEFMAMDAVADGAGDLLRERLGGSANVFLRGVLHVLKPEEQARLAANLHTLVGEQGRVFLAETNFQGNRFQYVGHLGATRRGIPHPLRRAIEGLPMPGHFGQRELTGVFPASRWQLLADGPAVIEAVPMKVDSVTEQIPGYFAVLQTS